MTLKSFVAIVALFSMLSHAEEGLGAEDYSERFSLEESRVTLEYVTEALNSFRELTEKSPKTLTDEIDNTSWDIQNLGFNNWMDTINGTLLLQQYQIAELRYQGLSNDATEDMRESVASQLKNAEKQYQQFIERLQVMD
ncbi:hypothetical protein [Agarivorans gilvus]|uniref:Uncharacterized protein n=1 Tax=Agarivorans gilvus TaxID=680279 RepID=A0ABQ1I731_9ALTE|nr:hypothetical protein [Agarivorans gilvus]GGB18774.1 hypothetical protein GCM10007414_35240 [Agarivorans gilvus]